MKHFFIFLGLILVCYSTNVIADESSVETQNNNILEKRVEFSSNRKCDNNKEDAEYKCICNLSIRYPNFTPKSNAKGSKKINPFIEDFIQDLRNKMSKCQVGGIDYGKNSIIYNILYEDNQYISIAFEKYFCCDENGAKPELFVFNFDKETGKLVDINQYLDIDNYPELSSLMDQALNKKMGRPDGYKNLLLQIYKNDVSQSQIKLRSFVYFYFNKDGITMKIWPDKSSFETIDVVFPNKLLKPRVYTITPPQDELLNDSLTTIPLIKDNGDEE